MRQKIWSASDVAGPVSGAGAAFGGGSTQNLGGGEGTLGMSGGEGGVTVSDIRAKGGVERVGEAGRDLPLYRFRYKGGSDEYIGVMAQDVLEVMPEAVSVGADGYYRVDYAKLGISMVRVEDGAAGLVGGEGIQESDIRVKEALRRVGRVDTTAGGEGSQTTSDRRLKEALRGVGTVADVTPGGEGGGTFSDLRLKVKVERISTIAIGGGEGSEVPSDIRIKDLIERIGTVRVVLHG
jgi:hypothetical protein